METIRELMNTFQNCYWDTEISSYEGALNIVEERISEITGEVDQYDSATVQYSISGCWRKDKEGKDFWTDKAVVSVDKPAFHPRHYFPQLSVVELNEVKDGLDQLQKLVVLRSKLRDASHKDLKEQRKSVKELTKGVL